MKAILPAASCALALSFSGASADMGVDASVGTTGASAHIHVDVMPRLTLRGGFNYLQFELEDEEFDDIAYDADLDFTQAGLYADLHPFKNSFTMTGGVVFGARDVGLVAEPMAPVEIGGMVFQPDEVGTLIGRGELPDQGIYAGIGWDGTTRTDSRIGLVLRAGVIVSDAPEFSLRAEGGLADNDPILAAMLQTELDAEVANLNREVDDFEIYPVISFGIGVKF